METIRYIAVKKLRPLEGIEQIIPLRPDAEMETLRQSLLDRPETIQPLTVMPDLVTVYKGRRQLALAAELGIKEVPCIVLHSANPMQDAVTDVLGTWSISPSQRAYLVFLGGKGDIMALQGLGQGGTGGYKRNESVPVTTTGYIDSIEEFAAKHGVSAKYLRKLAELYKKYPGEAWNPFHHAIWFGGQDDEDGVGKGRGTPIMRLESAITGATNEPKEPKIDLVDFDPEINEVTGVIRDNLKMLLWNIGRAQTKLARFSPEGCVALGVVVADILARMPEITRATVKSRIDPNAPVLPGPRAIREKKKRSLPCSL